MIPLPALQECAKSSKVAYVYLLRSLKTDRFYLGWTTDLERRLDEHNSGKSSYTKFRGPWKLIGYEICSSIEQAKRRERMLKRNPKMVYYFKKRTLATLRVIDALRQERQIVG